jgi:hypothetical protein
MKTNLELYGLENVEFTLYGLDDNYNVLKIEYMPKHASEPIILRSKIIRVGDAISEKMSWLNEVIDEEMYTKEVDNREDYRHLKKIKKQFCFE